MPWECLTGSRPGRMRRRWPVFVALALLLPVFVGVSLLDPAGVVAARHGALYGVAGAGETLTGGGASVRWHSTKIIRQPDAGDVESPLPPHTGIAVVTFDFKRERPYSTSQPNCVVRLTDATGRVWTSGFSTTGIARIYATSANRSGYQTCAEATHEGWTTGKWYRIQVRMVVASDIRKPLTVDIRDTFQPRPREFFRFHY